MSIATISFSFCGSILLHISYPAVLNSDCSASFLVLVSFSCSLCFFFMPTDQKTDGHVCFMAL